jgi:hypothetical protein
MPFFVKRRFSTSFAAYNVPPYFVATKYTVAIAPMPIAPSLLYFAPPHHFLTCESMTNGAWRVAGPNKSGYS